MARRRPSNSFGTIEYIGPRPQAKKPQRRPANFLGGWVVLLIAGFAAWKFSQPLLPLLRAQQSVASVEAADTLIGELAPSLDFGERLASAALQRTKMPSAFDADYYAISYPGGDLPLTSDGKWRGKAEDLIIRSYRNLGIDLQERVHQDMSQNFSVYPQLWKRREPDRNIDHRMVQNLQRYFKHQGAELPATREPSDYKPGDVIVWMLATGDLHCGIVVPGPGERRHEAWVIHDMGGGPKWENSLTHYQAHGHYRYAGVKNETADP